MKKKKTKKHERKYDEDKEIDEILECFKPRIRLKQ